jgi:HEAT repeat protein
MVLKQDSYRDRATASMRRIGSALALGGYSVLAAAVFLPILVEHAANPASAYGTLASLLGGIGGNLIANVVQGTYEQARSEGVKYDIAKLAATLEKQMQANDETSRAIALLVHKSGALGQASKMLRDLPEQWNAFAERLLNQVKHLSGTSIIVEDLHADRLIISLTESIPSTEFLVLDYLRLLAGVTDQLRLGTIDPKFEIDSPVKLSQVYVRPRVQGTGLSRRGQLGRLDDPIELVSKLFGRGDAQGIVLLGGPGAGKTALVDRLANSLSLGLLENLRRDADDLDGKAWRKQVPGWSTALVLPVRVSLQEFAARSLPADARHGASGYLWDHIEEKLRTDALLDFAQPLKLMLSGKMDLKGKIRSRDETGNGGLIFFDGLDEVPRYRRGVVEQCIDEFSTRFNQSVVVVTCRTYSWDQRDETMQQRTKRHPLDSFSVYEIAPFSQEQISVFVERWYTAVRSLKHMTDETVEYRIETLKSATKVPSLVSLSERPLLLTLMATLHTSRGQLPNDRATLYADCVDLLLEVWQRAKDLHIGGRTTVEGGLLEEFGVSSAEVERMLRKVAYDLHGTGMSREQLPQDQELLVTAEQLRKAFRPLVGNSWDEADRLVSYLERRAGLLEYEGDQAYRFPHRTFREFLAACYLLDEPGAPASLIQCFLSEPAWWGEVFSLAVGRQSRIGYSQAIQILHDTLCKTEKESDQNANIYATLLNTARDIGLADRQEDSAFYSDLLGRLIKAFMSHSSLTLDSRIVPERGSIFVNSSKVLVPHVLPLLGDERGGDAAAVYIGLYGCSELAPQLIPLLEDEMPSVRARAAHVLGGIGDPQAVDLLVRMTSEDESLEVVLQVLRALGKLGGDRAISALIDAIGDPDSEVRRVAVEELGRIGDEKAIYALSDRVRVASLDMAQTIIRALSAIANFEAIECLIELLDDEELSSFAEDALIEIRDPVIPQVREVYESTDDYGLIDHLRYILISLMPSPMLWREKDRDFTDQLSCELQNGDWP